ncbi:hypothetical protein LTR53_013798 [Teratosphaeriaceae sp. CCFEE 6253]|nr:hypothetical protein LTR53_013798 [Teratosphaeriaceae sp. CCFEE 6253]
MTLERTPSVPPDASPGHPADDTSSATATRNASRVASRIGTASARSNDHDRESEDESRPSESVASIYTTKSHRHEKARKDKLKSRVEKRFKPLSSKATRSYRETSTELVELNWRCNLGDSLPGKLKPRLRAPDGKRVGHKQYKRRLPVQSWTKTMLCAMVKLSHATQGDPTTAHAMLRAQIRRRQHKRTHPEHYAREVMTSDIDAVVQELKRLKAAGHYPPKGAGMTPPGERPDKCAPAFDAAAQMYEELKREKEGLCDEAIDERMRQFHKYAKRQAKEQSAKIIADEEHKDAGSLPEA